MESRLKWCVGQSAKQLGGLIRGSCTGIMFTLACHSVNSSDS